MWWAFALVSDGKDLIEISVSVAQTFTFLRATQATLIHSQSWDPLESPDERCAANFLRVFIWYGKSAYYTLKGKTK